MTPILRNISELVLDTVQFISLTVTVYYYSTVYIENAF